MEVMKAITLDCRKEKERIFSYKILFY